jgi:1-acyl-sn-glycerol-3-phosphate acyltransferase
MKKSFWYHVTIGITSSYYRLAGMKMKVTGLENIPEGPKLIVGNHPNATDAFTLPLIFKEQVIFLVEDKVFDIPIIGYIFRKGDQIPVIAGQGREALKTAIERIRQGYSVCIFPEGKITNTHEVTHAGTGVARLAIETGVPIVPIGFHVPMKFLKVIRSHQRGKETVGSWQIGGYCYVNIGKPFNVSLDEKLEKSYLLYRHFTEQIMNRIMELSVQAEKLADQRQFSTIDLNT